MILYDDAKENINTLEKGKFEKNVSDNGVDVRVNIKNGASNPVPVVIDPSDQVTIYNVSALIAGTEYSQSLNANVKKILIKVRGYGATLQLAYVASQSSTNYITIPRGASKMIDGINVPSLTLYFQTDKNSQIVEIEEWT